MSHASIMDLVAQTEGCWPWLGYIDKDGYGRVPWSGSNMAHRAVYELLIGPIPEGMQLDHLCHVREECRGGVRCLHRRCVRPDHLQAVSRLINTRRGHNANRNRTHCKWGHALVPGNVYIRKNGARMCRKCLRREVRKAILKKRATEGVTFTEAERAYRHAYYLRTGH